MLKIGYTRSAERPGRTHNDTAIRGAELNAEELHCLERVVSFEPDLVGYEPRTTPSFVRAQFVIAHGCCCRTEPGLLKCQWPFSCRVNEAPTNGPSGIIAVSPTEFVMPAASWLGRHFAPKPAQTAGAAALVCTPPGATTCVGLRQPRTWGEVAILQLCRRESPSSPGIQAQPGRIATPTSRSSRRTRRLRWWGERHERANEQDHRPRRSSVFPLPGTSAPGSMSCRHDARQPG